MERQIFLNKRVFPLFAFFNRGKVSQVKLGLFTLIYLILLMMFLGCASQKLTLTFQKELDNLRRELKFVKEQNSQLRRELDTLKKQLQEQERMARQNKADFAAQIEELMQQIEVIQNRFQDTNYRITALLQKLGPVPFSEPATEFEESSSETATSRDSTKLGSLGVDESRELYNTAYRDLIRGNYQLALHGFRHFLERFPNSDLSDNAQYWIGEVYYAQGRFPKAVEEFEKVVKWYPKGDKVPAALLKIGYAYISMSENEQGKLYLEEVLRDYPDSQEAKLAKGRLATLE